MIHIEPDSSEVMLDQVVTCAETQRLLGIKHRPSLMGKDRYADQYKLQTFMIGGIRVFLLDEVLAMGKDLVERTGSASRGRAKRRFATRKRELLKLIEEQRGDQCLDDYYTREETEAILGNSRQYLYQIKEQAKVRNIPVGRTTLFLKEDINAKRDKSREQKGWPPIEQSVVIAKS